MNFGIIFFGLEFIIQQFVLVSTLLPGQPRPNKEVRQHHLLTGFWVQKLLPSAVETCKQNEGHYRPECADRAG